MLPTLMRCVARKAGTGSCQLLIGERWLANFDILTILVRQDLEVQDKRQISGYFWSLLNQRLQLLIHKCILLNVHLSRACLPTNQTRYGLWLFTKLLPWLAFTSGLTLADKAMAKQPNIVNKVGVPSEVDLRLQCCRLPLKRRLA